MSKKRSSQESTPDGIDEENEDSEARSNVVLGKFKLLVALNQRPTLFVKFIPLPILMKTYKLH